MSDPAANGSSTPDASAHQMVSATDPTVPAEVPTTVAVKVAKDAKVGRSGRRRRTWPQRMLLALNIVVILGCFAAAGGLIVSRYYGNTLNRVELADASENTLSGTTSPDAGAGDGGDDGGLVAGTIDVDDTTDATEATDADARRRPSPRPIPRPATSSSPAPTTTPASTRTRSTPQPSATARAWASAATRS
jgi:hypothetical protein